MSRARWSLQHNAFELKRHVDGGYVLSGRLVYSGIDKTYRVKLKTKAGVPRGKERIRQLAERDMEKIFGKSTW